MRKWCVTLFDSTLSVKYEKYNPILINYCWPKTCQTGRGGEGRERERRGEGGGGGGGYQ